ncbi:glycoside hydrolase family 32 protein [Vagococcus entomophilus]|uniref:Sucrose-6-phosphate hydrolase n=1 Tax=Vagococcus entomophilus TaxID=1160095 RepID=A0A430AKL4_9ENTE|nr:glycoside hydrolase family 32 protein [Vagococcus entomophilus]RSU08651.1 hypothetical protein CBF30_05340 [Vagococcus entomophilus]
MKFLEIDKYHYVTAKDQGYLRELAKFVSKSEFLPKFHIYPKSGLMNDPNGLSYYNGAYHVFYQWFPFDATHGMKHWGHMKSQDLLHWQDCGLALIPDQEYEKNGCYSGGAIEKDGLLYLFYTANYKTSAGKIPKQALAIMNQAGQIEKYAQNPILDGAPKGYSGELRDPFVFERDGAYYMLLGGSADETGTAKSFGQRGALLLYQSSNLIDWAYKGEVELPIETGYMLECPSLIEVDGKEVLFLSPMGYQPQKNRYQNRFASIYLLGKLDVLNLRFDVEQCDELDAGFDYYAPQAFYAKDNVPLSFAWFGCGEPLYESDKEKWKHGLTMPHELSLRSERLHRFPSKEILAAFSMLECNQKLVAPKMSFYHFSTEVSREQKNATIVFGNPGNTWQLDIDTESGEVILDRSNLATPIDVEYGEDRRTILTAKTAIIQVDVFVDNSFIEIFLNQGEKVFSFRSFNLAKDHMIVSESVTNCKIGYYNR